MTELGRADRAGARRGFTERLCADGLSLAREPGLDRPLDHRRDPTLTPAQIARFAKAGRERLVAKSEILFDQAIRFGSTFIARVRVDIHCVTFVTGFEILACTSR